MYLDRAQKLVRRILSYIRAHQLTVACIFGVFSIIFGIFYIVDAPVMWGADEPAHFQRAYQISRGHLLAQNVGDSREAGGYGGEIPENIVTMAHFTEGEFMHSNPDDPFNRVSLQQADVYGILTHRSVTSPNIKASFPNTAAYSPIPYIPSVFGIWVARLVHANIGMTVRLARVTSLLAFTACVMLALYVLRKHRSKWIVMAIALLPMTLFQGAMVTADAMTNAIALLLAALLIKGWRNDSYDRLDIFLLCLACITLPLLKSTYVFIPLLVLTVPRNAFKLIGRGRIYAITSVTLGLIGFAGWLLLTRDVAPALAYIKPTGDWDLINPNDQLHMMVTQPWTFATALVHTITINDSAYISNMFGALGFGYVHIPGIAQLASIIGLCIACMVADELKFSKLVWWAIVAAGVLLGAVSIFATLYMTWSRVGGNFIEGVQGRYFMPLLPFMCILIVRIFPGRLNSYRTGVYALLAVASFSLLLSAAKYHYFTHG